MQMACWIGCKYVMVSLQEVTTSIYVNSQNFYMFIWVVLITFKSFGRRQNKTSRLPNHIAFHKQTNPNQLVTKIILFFKMIYLLYSSQEFSFFRHSSYSDACFNLGIHLIKIDQYLSHQRVHACWLFQYIRLKVLFCAVLSKASIFMYSLWRPLSWKPAEALASWCRGEVLDSVVAKTSRNNNRNVCERNMSTLRGFDHVSALYRIFQVKRSFSNGVLTRLIPWRYFKNFL